MPAPYDVLTPTRQLVLQKMASDPQVRQPPCHQVVEVAEPIRINNVLRAMDQAIPIDEIEISPVWHRHRSRR